MRSSSKGEHSLFAAVSIAALSISLGGAFADYRDQPAAAHLHSKVDRVISAVPGAVTLYDRNSDDAGVAVPSTYDAYHYQGTWGATDFWVPKGHRWRILEVEVSGAYAPGQTPKKDPNLSESIYIYTDNNGLPEHLLRECDYIKGREHNGSFAIRLRESCFVSLQGGLRYWISVAAIMDRFAYGEWRWETRSHQNKYPAVWETTEDYTSGCFEQWGVMTSCVDNGEGPDFMFALKGQDQLVK